MTTPKVPFAEELGCSGTAIKLPATYHRLSHVRSSEVGQILRQYTHDSHVAAKDDRPDRRAFLKCELNVTRLNMMHKYLWLAGLERPARPLHRQIAIGREIVLTESADLHMLWAGERIYLKPLPDFLCSHGIWVDLICNDADLYEQACGLLLSYLWLICHRSDFCLAQKHFLIPDDLTWDWWTSFALSASQNLDLGARRGVNIRYRYGELRLSRINLIYRFYQPFRLSSVFRGYLTGFHHYESFLKAYLAWLLTAAVYMALVLQALQVGLQTADLITSAAFQKFSYGFAIFSIIGPAVVMVAVLMLTLVVVTFNAHYALRYCSAFGGYRSSKPEA